MIMIPLFQLLLHYPRSADDVSRGRVVVWCQSDRFEVAQVGSRVKKEWKCADPVHEALFVMNE